MKPLRKSIKFKGDHVKQSLASVTPASLLLVGLSGCSRAPSQDILGSFFPAWMLCAAVGCSAAGLARLLVGGVHLNKYVLAPPLGYFAFAVAVTLFTWLFQFGQ